MPRPDAFETLDRQLDPTADLGLVPGDPAELFGGVAKSGLGAGLVAVQRPEDALLPRDRAAQLLLALARGLDLVGEAGGIDRARRARRHHDQDRQGEERQDGPVHGRSSCSRDHARISCG